MVSFSSKHRLIDCVTFSTMVVQFIPVLLAMKYHNFFHFIVVAKYFAAYALQLNISPERMTNFYGCYVHTETISRNAIGK